MLGLSLLYPHLRGMAWAGRLEVWPGQPRAASGRGRGQPRSEVLPRAPGPEWFRPQFSPPLSHAGRLPWAERHLLRCALRAGHAIRRPHHGYRLPGPYSAARPRYVYHRRRLGDPRPFQRVYAIASPAPARSDSTCSMPTSPRRRSSRSAKACGRPGRRTAFSHSTSTRPSSCAPTAGRRVSHPLPQWPSHMYPSPLHPRLSTLDYRPAPLVAPRLAIAALSAHRSALSRITAVHTFVQLLCTLFAPTPRATLSRTQVNAPRADLQRGARRVVVAL